MEIRNGAKPIVPNPKQISFPITFGTVHAADLPDFFSADAKLTMPDQVADGLPFGCTGYMTCELAVNEESMLFRPGFNYDRAREMADVAGQDVGVEIKTALKAATVYGLEMLNGAGDPLDNRRAPYSEVHPHNGLDYFDSIRSAMLVAFQKDGKKHAVGVGTPWLPEWSQIGSDGIIPSIYTYDGIPDHFNWHAYCFVACGIVQGELRLIAKTWQGFNYGNGGYSSYNREQVNKIFDEWGTGVFMQLKAKPEDYKRIQYTIIETAVGFIMRMLKLGGFKDAFSNLVAILKVFNA